MLVKYQYRADDPSLEGNDVSPTKGLKAQTKDFEFYTVVDLGPVVAKDDRRMDDF